jgi:oligopeptide/dipeptide ABC transporter ATP-binding protein
MSKKNEIINVENLYISYLDKKKDRIDILKDINFSLNEGEALGILGESGSGKTILAKVLMNIIPHPLKITQGSININKLGNILKKNDELLQSIRGKQISMIPSNPHEYLNPLENIETQIMNVILAHKKDISKKECYEKAIKILNEVQIPDPKKRMYAYPNELSGGMAQRVTIAMSLINEPQLIIADNPTFGLDVTTQIEIMNLLKNLLSKRGSCLIMNSTSAPLLIHYCDIIAVLYHGIILEYTDIYSFKKNPNHPYSSLLLASETLNFVDKDLPIKSDKDLKKEQKKHIIKGCLFQNVCKLADKSCFIYSPKLVKISNTHFVRCKYYYKNKSNIINF